MTQETRKEIDKAMHFAVDLILTLAGIILLSPLLLFAGTAWPLMLLIVVGLPATIMLRINRKREELRNDD